MEILDLILHRYIRTGESVLLYWPDKEGFEERIVRVDGWGAYAPVKIGVGYIRRDCIRKEGPNWVYHYED